MVLVVKVTTVSSVMIHQSQSRQWSASTTSLAAVHMDPDAGIYYH